LNKIEYVVLINQSNKIEYGYRRLNGKEISIPYPEPFDHNQVQILKTSYTT